MSRRDKPFASLIYTKKLKTYPQPMKSLNLWKKYQFSHLHHFATRFVKKIVKQIRANLKPKKTMNAIPNSASRHCSRFHASVHIQPWFIWLAFEKKEKEKKAQLEKVKEISTKTI